MKNFLFVLLVLFISACHEDEHGLSLDYPICTSELSLPVEKTNASILSVDEWPVEIRTYLASEFSGFFIDSLESYQDDLGKVYYLVIMNNQGSILFDAQKNLICGDASFQMIYDDEKIAIEDLPEKIVDYITVNYPNATIAKAELDDGEYEIRLSNGIKLCFDQAANYIGNC